MKVQIKRK